MHQQGKNAPAAGKFKLAYTKHENNQCQGVNQAKTDEQTNDCPHRDGGALTHRQPRCRQQAPRGFLCHCGSFHCRGEVGVEAEIWKTVRGCFAKGKQKEKKMAKMTNDAGKDVYFSEGRRFPSFLKKGKG